MNWIDYLRDQVTKLAARVAVLEGVSLLDYCHPVGSIYESTVNTNPGTLFGGTWERIKDRFILAAGDVYTAGVTGGEATHTLTIDEIPPHSHTTSVALWALKVGGGSQEFGSGSSTSTQITLNSVGGGIPHNNLPPYLVVYVWVRTK